MTDPNSDLINHIDVNSTTECALHIKLAQNHYAQRQEMLHILICLTSVTMAIFACVFFIALQQFKASLIRQDREQNPVELYSPAPALAPAPRSAPSLSVPQDFVKSTPHRFTA